MSGVAQQKSPPIAYALSGPHVHFEIRNPSQIVQTEVDADAGIEQCPQLFRGRKFGPHVSLIAIDEDKPTVARERREQPEPGRPHNDAPAFGRTWQADFRVGNNKSAVVSLAIKMLLHRMARYAVSAARTEHISHRETLGSAATFERHAQAGRVIFDRLYLCAVLNVDAYIPQVIAQDGFGLPLRQAALKFMFASDTREFRGRDFLQTRSEQLNLPDAHARVKKWLDQASPLDDVQRRRLQRGPASLVMRRQSALDDARLDAMPNKFARRE